MVKCMLFTVLVDVFVVVVVVVVRFMPITYSGTLRMFQARLNAKSDIIHLTPNESGIDYCIAFEW